MTFIDACVLVIFAAVMGTIAIMFARGGRDL